MNAHDFENVLVAIDDCEGHAAALEWALSLCSSSKAKLTVVAITSVPRAAAAWFSDPGQDTHCSLSRVLLDIKREARDRGVNARVEVLPGSSQQTIAHYAAAHDHDLIVLQHRGSYLREVLHPLPIDSAAPDRACPVIVIG